MFNNHEYGSAAVDDPHVWADNKPEPTDAERDLESLIDAQAACTDAWEAARYAPAILAAIEATEAHAHDGAPECGDLSEVTEGWGPSEREAVGV
jgi:plasmid stabilization system protein ParE